MKAFKFFLCLVSAITLAASAFAQNPTATLSGRVDDGKAPIPGVTITVASPNMQGARNTVSSVNGDYIFRFLPPGDYSVKFELHGFQTVDTTVKLSAAQTSTVNATMPQAKVAEEVTVTGSYETISTSAQAASTVTQEMLNKLPIGQNFNNYAALAAGTTVTGPSQALVISGAQSWENLMMVNGVNIQDNIRLTPGALYIEDAIQETTTQTASISAEYGRFAGGVVNMITRSGGNEMHGSGRLNLDTGDINNQNRGGKWSNKEPLRTAISSDTINKTWMATLGGWILKDRLWYFAGYRTRKIEATGQTYVTNLPFPITDDQQRYEGKLTFALNANHRFIGSYLKVPQTQGGNYFGFPMDLASVYTRQVPSTLTAGNYTGVLTDNFFVEGQYSKKTFEFIGSGSQYTDLIKGTLLIDLNLGNSYRYGSPTFCGVCDPERRDNQEYIGKASYFLSTAGMGTHDIVGGVDVFDDQRFSNNHQSGSDFRIRGTDVIIRDGVIYPQWLNSNTVVRWTPIFSGSKGTHFKTDSAFLNDRWRFTNNLSFNIGVRYDKNDGRDSDGKLVAKDSNVSPRLGLSWDPKGDGDVQVNLGYAKYVAAIANGIADLTALGGQPGTIDFSYKGPEINPDKNAATLIDQATALKMLFDWFQANVDLAHFGSSPYLFGSPFIPGASAAIKNSLNSTNAQEWSLGVTKRINTRGLFRVDLVDRKFGDFYDLALNTTTGTVTTPNGTFDKGYYVNNNSTLKRDYQAAQFQFSYRLTDRLNLGGNYTLSKLHGNEEGENTTSGPIVAGALYYPEYFQLSWAFPKGDLSADQRHKVRFWGVYDLLNTKRNRLSASILASYFSGTPYGAFGTINLAKSYVTNPGYLNPPTTQTYYFTNRDAFHTDNENRIDVSLNYAFKTPALGADIEFFIEPRIVNVFNAAADEAPNASVYTSRNAGKGLVAFNPFTTKAIECPQNDTAAQCTALGANWQKAPTFGHPTSPNNYQQPRTFTLSVGMRF